MAELAAIFRKPFPEQVAAFRLRLGDLVPTARWDDITRNAHDRAFMVAGATKADLLSDIGAAVEKAIADGTGFEAFQRDFRDIVERHGWHGWTGEGTPGGEAWRMRVIYRTNMRVSYQAGRFAQLREGGFKYWVYRHGGSDDPRPEHLALDGLILPADHPFWMIWFPPNGWGCSCRVFGARSMEAAIRRGGNPAVRLPTGWNTRDPRSGTPKGIDKGWDYAPGASAADTILAFRDKLEKLQAQPSQDLIGDWLQWPFKDWFENPRGAWPLARLGDDDAQLIGSQPRVAELSAETLAKQRRRHPELTLEDYAQAQATVNLATNKVQDGDSSMIFVRADPGEAGHVLVVKTTKTGQGLFVTSFRRLSSDDLKRDQELIRLMRKGD
ncbi:phage minor head protein [Tritonibacter scottomollicae]|uniref:Phage Mu protein F like protein n=1 Tax=Tritonibacter scottomollicae TaxID=483013 RepID=A0A2T1AIA6_TRISK|nr:phage minor head protein [Tritonibacter scottomollicae]PRZ48339.1 phage Mu protein F like protein [Tritonibacter scottomollicae]